MKKIAERNEIETVTLCVTASQGAAISAYVGAGFEETSRSDHQMGDGQIHSVIHMQRDIRRLPNG